MAITSVSGPVLPIAGQVFRSKPSKTPDGGLPSQPRLSIYGDHVMQPLSAQQEASDEGSYFMAGTPTSGTGVASVTSLTGETLVSPQFLIINASTPTDPNNVRIYLDYIRMICTAVPTSATAWQFSAYTDNLGVAKYTSAGSALTVVSPNADSSVASKALVYAGALVAVTNSQAARRVFRACGKSVIPVANDQWELQFSNGTPTGSQVLSTATAALFVMKAAPVILGPGESLAVYAWGASSAAAPGFEYEVGWTER